MQVLVYIATSVDGFIARRDGGIDWLSVVERAGEDYGYTAFYDSVDAVIMGRKTYELSTSFGDWPYPGKPGYVLTSGAPASSRSDVNFVRGDVPVLYRRLVDAGHQRVWLVGGGELVSAFHRAGLVGEYILSVIPVVLGDGIPLFVPPLPERQLVLIEARHYPSGLVQMRYRCEPPAGAT